MTYWLLVIAVICAVAFWLRQHREKTKPASRVADVYHSSKYHCVAITHSNNPCESVKRLEGKRFLSNEAPILKLHGCDADSCQCRHIHYDDRREEDRRNPFGRYSSIHPTSIDQDRRKQLGRRNTDVVKLDAHRML